MLIALLAVIFAGCTTKDDGDDDLTLLALLLASQSCTNTGTARYFAVTGSNLSSSSSVPSSASYSADGTCWTHTTLSSANPLSSIAFANGTFVGVGVGPSAYTATEFLGTWTAATGLSGTVGLLDVVHTGTRFVSVGFQQAYYSADGAAWTAATSTINARFNEMINISYLGSTRQVAVGVFNARSAGAYSTDHGDNWVSATMPTTGSILNAVAYSGTRLVAVGQSGTCLYSDDGGANWTVCTISSVSTAQYNSIAYGNGRFVAIGSDFSNSVWTSTDGITWSPVTTSGLSIFDGLIYANNRFNAGTTAYSTDGQTWTAAGTASGSNTTNFSAEKVIYQ